MVKQTIAICWIGIGAYNSLYKNFYESIIKNFCQQLDKHFFIFTDQPELYDKYDNSTIIPIIIQNHDPSYIKWRKFKMLLYAEDLYFKYDFLAYCNANFYCNKTIDFLEIFNYQKPLTCVSHPGNIKFNANQRYLNEKTCASICKNNSWLYKQAGFILSTTKIFMHMMNTIECWRYLDKINGTDKYVLWHDEAYFNKYCIKYEQLVNIINGKIYLNCFNDFENAKSLVLIKNDIFKKNKQLFKTTAQQHDLYYFNNTDNNNNYNIIF